MKFGCTFEQYLEKEKELLLDDNCAHIEYNRLKTVLKSCQNCKDNSSDDDKDQLCQCQSCQCMCPVFLFVYVLFLFFTMYFGNEQFRT
jgi:hypothetical protein